MQVMCIKCYTSYKCTDFNVHPSCPPYMLKDMCDVIHTHQQLTNSSQLQLKGPSHVGCASCHYKVNEATQSQHISLLCTVF